MFLRKGPDSPLREIAGHAPNGSVVLVATPMAVAAPVDVVVLVDYIACVAVGGHDVGTIAVPGRRHLGRSGVRTALEPGVVAGGKLEVEVAVVEPEVDVAAGHHAGAVLVVRPVGRPWAGVI